MPLVGYAEHVRWREDCMPWVRVSPEADRRKVPHLAEACGGMYCTAAYQKRGELLSLPPHVYPFRVRVFDQPCVGPSPQRRTPFVVILNW